MKRKLAHVPKTMLAILTSGFLLFMVACGDAPNSPAVPAVSGTANPLVAQYTVLSSCPGKAMVEFGPDTTYGRSTPWYPVAGDNGATTILVAGMRASSTYHMHAVVQCATGTTTTADTTFTTGALPSLPFPALTVSRPNPSLSSTENPGIEMITIPVAGTPAFFTDRDGNPIWYYDVGQGSFPFTFKPLPDGNIVISITAPSGSLLREIDLAGNVVRELKISDLQQQAAAAGYDFVPSGYHHDVLPLANGHVIVLLNTFQNFTDLPGYTGTITVEGDAIIDLDPNWHVAWAWNGFDHLDVNRHLQPTLDSNNTLDWTHSNALVYSPSDGSVILSMRHQSWVIKINYDNGTGDGTILWKLGYQGDFALTQNGVPTDDPSLWFSFQHFPVLLSQNGSQSEFAVWDNGDNRVLDPSGAECVNPALGTPPCYSRATIYNVDESAKVADLEWSDLQTAYGLWGGSINRLQNGNVEFDLNAPVLPPVTGLASQVLEVTQSDSPQTVWQMNIPMPYFAYRAYRVPSLYTDVTWQY